MLLWCFQDPLPPAATVYGQAGPQVVATDHQTVATTDQDTEATGELICSFFLDLCLLQTYLSRAPLATVFTGLSSKQQQFIVRISSVILYYFMFSLMLSSHLFLSLGPLPFFPFPCSWIVIIDLLRCILHLIPYLSRHYPAIPITVYQTAPFQTRKI